LTSISRFSIKIVLEGIGEAEGELIRFKAPRTVDAVLKNLPLEGRLALWKNAEVYFEVPIKVGSEKPVSEVKKGTIAYWPMGSAVCIFFEDLKPYSPVNVIGRVTEGIELFKLAKSGTIIRMHKA
jgi:hypothetical protein